LETVAKVLLDKEVLEGDELRQLLNENKGDLGKDQAPEN